MEGNKKPRGFFRDCQAVSELMGVVLMISIVVLAFSSIAVTVFSDGGTMDPTHTPHTNLRENLDKPKNTVKIFHNGGEAIDLKYIKIILEVDGEQVEFNMSDPAVTVLNPEGNNSNDTVFNLEDCIVINSSSKVDITDADAIDLYFVHTESGQVIQKTMLWRDSASLPYWITPYPYGSVYDSYANKWLDQELVDKVGDKQFTENDFPHKIPIYENFTFGSLDDLDISEDATFSKVILKIVYRIHDQSAKLELNIYNETLVIKLDDLTKKGYTPSENNSDFVESEFEITEYVKNARDLENLVVRISTTPNAADQAGKEGWIDFIGIHLEY